MHIHTNGLKNVFFPIELYEIEVSYRSVVPNYTDIQYRRQTFYGIGSLLVITLS